MEESHLYQYTPLPPVANNEHPLPFTRILDLAPGSGDELFQGSLSIVRVDQTPPYESLSYCWGVGDAETALWLDDERPIPIKPNLALALQYIRLPDRSRRLWIDAICINQDDSNEKADQVAKMRHIYENASQVIVWLGPCTAGCDVLLDLIIEMGQAFDDSGLARIDVHSMQNSSEQELADNHAKLDLLIEKFENIIPYSFPREAYEAFVARPWWRRVWVVQELTVNKELPIFAVGHYRIGYQQLMFFELFLRFLGTKILAQQDLSQLEGQSEGGSNETSDTVDTQVHIEYQEQLIADTHAIVRSTAMSIMTSFRLRFSSADGNRPHKLLSILKHALIYFNERSSEGERKELLATDERDRIYALLGLAEDAHVVSKIPIDYSKEWTAAHVYCATTRALLSNGELEVLSITRDPLSQRTRGLPTWVCTWAPETCQLPIGDSTKFEHPFQAGGTFELGDIIVYEDTNDIISIKGIRIGAVVSLTSRISPRVQKSFQLDRASRSLQGDQPEWYVWKPVARFIGETQDLATKALRPSTMTESDVARLLLGDHELVEQSAATLRANQEASLSPNLAIQQLPYLRRCDPNSTLASNRLQFALRWAKLGIVIQDLIEGAVDEENVIDHIRREMAQMSDLLPILASGFWVQFGQQMRRRAWLTDTKYLGLGPPETLEGDVVVIFKGSPTPHVLRKVPGKNRWMLVGEAYVHGAMDGELWQGEDVSVEIFTLE